MKVKYDVVVRVTVTHEINTLDDLKTDREFANDLSQFICDEAVNAGGVACCDIIERSIQIK